MSVPVGNRKEAGLEFLKNARDIECTLIDLRINKPKRYTFFFDKMLDLGMKILTECKEGNSIFPTNLDEAVIRAIHFKEAYAACQALGSQIDVIRQKFRDDAIPIGLVEQFAEMLTKEMRLLQGLIKSDRQRFKRFYPAEEIPDVKIITT